MTRASWIPMVALLAALLAPSAAPAAPAPPAAAKEPVLQAIHLGVQVPFAWERQVRTTWNEGVRAPGEPSVEDRTEPRLEENIQFSADITDVAMAGDGFSGTWRNTHGTDFYDEFVNVTGELTKDRKRLKWAEIRRQRFDRASVAEPPLDHGLTTQVLRVEDLPDARNFPRNPPMYALRPDGGRLAVEEATLHAVHDTYHSREVTTDRALGVDTGKTAGGLQKVAAVTLTFRYANPALPPPRKVFVKGDWPGIHFVLAALADLPGLDVFDRTDLAEGVRRGELELSKSGLVGQGVVADRTAKDPDVTVRVTRATREKGDMSAEALVRSGETEQSFRLDLKATAFDAFGPEGSTLYLARRLDAFAREVARAVGPGQQAAPAPAKAAGRPAKDGGEEPASVAVVSFEDARCIEGRRGAAASSAAEEVQYHATRGDELVLVDRGELFPTLLAELDRGTSALADPDHAPRLGRLIGARYLVLGGHLAAPRGLRKTALRLVDVQTSQVLATDAFEAASHDEEGLRLEGFSKVLRGMLPGK